MNKYMLFCALDKVTLLLTFNVKIINSVYVRFVEWAEEMEKERRLKWSSPKLIRMLKMKKE